MRWYQVEKVLETIGMIFVFAACVGLVLFFAVLLLKWLLGKFFGERTHESKNSEEA